MGRPKNRLIEQPVPQALGPKSQPLRPGRAAGTFSANPDPSQDSRSQFERWLFMLVGEENRECVLGIVEAALILTEDVLKLGLAIDDNTPMLELSKKLFTDLINIALSLPPKCLSDDAVATSLGRVYEIMQLAQDESAMSDPETRGRIVELILQLPDMEILDKYPGLDEQLAEKLIDSASNANFNTQADILVALLPDAAVKDLDEALSLKASELPGASFITTLNDYDNKLGINIIPDDVVEGYAVDLVLRTAAVTGLVAPKDSEMLLGLVSLLRNKVSRAGQRTIMDRIKDFVKALGAPKPAPELPHPRKPVRIEIVPRGKEIMTPAPTPTGQLDEGTIRRMKVLAGIK